MPKKKAKAKAKKAGKRDYSTSSMNVDMLDRIRIIHECLSSKYTDDTGRLRCYGKPQILNYLRNHHNESDISESTLKRDLRYMRDRMELPIIHDRKMGGLRYEEEIAELPLIQANEADLFGMFLLEHTLQSYEGTAMYGQLKSTMDKVLASTSGEVNVSLGDLTEAVSVRDTKTPQVVFKNLKAITDAVQKRWQLKITYKSPSAKSSSERTVDPYHAGNINGVWYVFAYDHKRKAIVPFKMVRIEKAGTTGKEFTRPRDFRVEDHLDWGVGRGKTEYKIEADFIPKVAPFLREKVFHPTQKLEVLDNGKVRATWTITDAGLQEFRAWFLGWGTAAKLNKPKKLRDTIKNIAAGLGKMYDDD